MHLEFIRKNMSNVLYLLRVLHVYLSYREKIAKQGIHERTFGSNNTPLDEFKLPAVAGNAATSTCSMIGPSPSVGQRNRESLKQGAVSLPFESPPP